ncbi:hypothetical protein PVAP13_1KG297915, partial [Panicum virgatum]
HENNRGSPMMLVKLYSHMSNNQRRLIDDAGFGGLLSQLFPDLCQWLLDCYDPESSELLLSGRGRIPITEAIVHRVMGIPRGSKLIKCEIDASASSFMQNEFDFTKGNQPKISELLNSLKMNKSDNPKYLRTWALFAACSVITPTFSTKVSPRLFSAVVDSKKICEQNWCELVIRNLKLSRSSDPKKHSFKPCLTFLMVLYLDSLDTGFKRISTRGCRVSVWTTKLAIKAIAKDTKPDGSFGALQLKSEFTGQDNILFGHHVPLEDFINTHVHESFGNQERLRAKRVVQQMCSGFSNLVSKFLLEFYQPHDEQSDDNANEMEDAEIVEEEVEDDEEEEEEEEEDKEEEEEDEEEGEEGEVGGGGGGGDVDEEDCEIHDAADANRYLGLHWVSESNEPTISEDIGDSFFFGEGCGDMIDFYARSVRVAPTFLDKQKKSDFCVPLDNEEQQNISVPLDNANQPNINNPLDNSGVDKDQYTQDEVPETQDAEAQQGKRKFVASHLIASNFYES